MATGATVAVVGAAPVVSDACCAEPVVVEVAAVADDVVPVAVVAVGRDIAMAAAPRALAAPAPRVIADTQTSPLLRTICRAEPGAGVPVGPVGPVGSVLARRWLSWLLILRGSLSMPQQSTGSLCAPEVLPLSRL